jgi:hypothetical protein
LGQSWDFAPFRLRVDLAPSPGQAGDYLLSDYALRTGEYVIDELAQIRRYLLAGESETDCDE